MNAYSGREFVAQQGEGRPAIGIAGACRFVLSRSKNKRRRSQCNDRCYRAYACQTWSILDPIPSQPDRSIAESPRHPRDFGPWPVAPLARLCGLDPADAQHQFVQRLVVGQLDRSKLSVG